MQLDEVASVLCKVRYVSVGRYPSVFDDASHPTNPSKKRKIPLRHFPLLYQMYPFHLPNMQPSKSPHLSSSLQHTVIIIIPVVRTPIAPAPFFLPSKT